MMHLNGWFGSPSTWMLLGVVWLAVGIFVALALGVIARVGAGRGKK